jgi:hypothetical protein
MGKSIHRNIKIRKITPQANLDETEALMDLLYECTKGNAAHCARLMGISRRTWIIWAKDPPTEWYWPLVLRTAIKHTLSNIVATRRATSKKFQRNILEALSKIPQHKDFEEEIANMAYEVSASVTHLRTLLARRGMWWSEIKLAANNGGYSTQTLRKAAKIIGIVRRQEGFGKDKDSFWRLPNEDDD